MARLAIRRPRARPVYSTGTTGHHPLSRALLASGVNALRAALPRHPRLAELDDLLERGQVTQLRGTLSEIADRIPRDLPAVRAQIVTAVGRSQLLP